MMQPTRLETMQRTSFEPMNCSVAQCLEVIGEWWSMLIVRDAFLGVRRFDDFQSRLGISRNILTTRLTSLVEAGVLRRCPTRSPPAPRIPPHRQGPRPVAGAHRHAGVGRPVGGPRRPPARGRARRLRRGLGRRSHLPPLWRGRRPSLGPRPARPGRDAERLRSDRPAGADMSAAHVEQLAAAFAVVGAHDTSRANEDARHQLELAWATLRAVGGQAMGRSTPTPNCTSSIEPRIGRAAGAVGTDGERVRSYPAQHAASANKEIGAELLLSPRTVATYLCRALPKLASPPRRTLHRTRSPLELDQHQR